MAEMRCIAIGVGEARELAARPGARRFGQWAQGLDAGNFAAGFDNLAAVAGNPHAIPGYLSDKPIAAAIPRRAFERRL